MLDFFEIEIQSSKKGSIEIFPSFIVKKSKDLMIKGNDFYAIWDEEAGLWSTDEDDAIRLIDAQTKRYFEENKSKYGDTAVKPLYLRQARNGTINGWKQYIKKQMNNNYHPLDEQLTYLSQKVKKTDYVSKRLPYDLSDDDCPAFKRLLSVIYADEGSHKICWAIGSIVAGESKNIQKFFVLYGKGGTGKSTILHIIEWLFPGYYCSFTAKSLGDSNDAFAMEQFRANPLVAIQHDGDLSKIKDNARINSLVSHEEMMVNEKFKSTYSMRFNCMLFMGSNSTVKITDAKSGIIRRLIDIEPTGEKVSTTEYRKLMEAIKFELGSIARYCLEIYQENPHYYDDYIPTRMLTATNDFYNFITMYREELERDDGITPKAAWSKWDKFCTIANLPSKGTMSKFGEELRDYFDEFYKRYPLPDGTRVWSYYKGFRYDKFESKFKDPPPEPQKIENRLNLIKQPSIFDKIFEDCPAQYANADEHPCYKWENVNTKLKDIDSSELHYVNLPDNIVVIDLDRKNAEGNKDYELNESEALKWPATYTELSKGGAGIHLHYIYTGDPDELASLYDTNIEVKKFTGSSSLRRRVTKCNNLPLAILSKGDLPLKEKKMVNKDVASNSEHLKNRILYAIKNKTGGGTYTAVDYIRKELEKAHNSGMEYDVSELEGTIYSFASCSSNHRKKCQRMVEEMIFKSDNLTSGAYSEIEEATPVFYDVEVMKNLFVIVWKPKGMPPVKWINPTPEQVEWLITNDKILLIGFNCRRYDNHICYARAYEHEDCMALFNRSQNIISNIGKPFFGPAYDLSWIDLYDCASKKQSLKKWEIELGIHHQELGLKWDEEVPEELFETVADYCVNDVLATEAVFDAIGSDIEARKILADIADMPVNTPTNTLTTNIIFGPNKTPQNLFNYRNLAEPILLNNSRSDYESRLPIGFTAWDGTYSDLPCFPGYKYERGVSTYRGEEVGEGGFVYSNPGMYRRVITFDVASMHPHSVTTENLFGPFTEQFEALMELRVAIKHEDYDKASKMLDGKVAKYLTDKKTAKGLSKALKLAINSVYGLTAAKFDNPFRDERNVDNIVAKRGALFMIDLMKAVQERGYKVVHIKTDSIKLEDPSPELCDFVMDFGKKYGYTFEIEHKFEKICLVNNAVYIAKLAEDDDEYDNDKDYPGHWTATGAQFAHPYIFKTWFSKKPIDFADLCETKTVTTALYLDMNEGHEDEHAYQFVGKAGQFCPIIPGRGGGMLMREKDGKYSAATGTKGYRWLESEHVKLNGLEDNIDMSYFKKLADDAADDIREFGDFEWFSD